MMKIVHCTGRPGKKGDPLGMQDGSSEEQQLEKARAVFATIDKDGSGGISLSELQIGLQEVLGFDADEEMVWHPSSNSTALAALSAPSIAESARSRRVDAVAA